MNRSKRILKGFLLGTAMLIPAAPLLAPSAASFVYAEEGSAEFIIYYLNPLGDIVGTQYLSIPADSTVYLEADDLELPINYSLNEDWQSYYADPGETLHLNLHVHRTGMDSPVTEASHRFSIDYNDPKGYTVMRQVTDNGTDTITTEDLIVPQGYHLAGDWSSDTLEEGKTFGSTEVNVIPDDPAILASLDALPQKEPGKSAVTIDYYTEDGTLVASMSQPVSFMASAGGESQPIYAGETFDYAVPAGYALADAPDSVEIFPGRRVVIDAIVSETGESADSTQAEADASPATISAQKEDETTREQLSSQASARTAASTENSTASDTKDSSSSSAKTSQKAGRKPESEKNVNTAVITGTAAIIAVGGASLAGAAAAMKKSREERLKK